MEQHALILSVATWARKDEEMLPMVVAAKMVLLMVVGDGVILIAAVRGRNASRVGASSV